MKENDERVKMFNGILKAIDRYEKDLANKRKIIRNWAVEHGHALPYGDVPDAEDYLHWSYLISSDFDAFMKWFRMNYDPTFVQ